jgi:hypothetical protein
VAEQVDDVDSGAFRTTPLLRRIQTALAPAAWANCGFCILRDWCTESISTTRSDEFQTETQPLDDHLSMRTFASRYPFRLHASRNQRTPASNQG